MRLAANLFDPGDDGVEPHVRIPDDRGYPVTSEPLETAFRA
jgi:hypothetical protein